MTDFIVHEDFNYQQTGLQHDIVLLELADHVYLDVYTPACLPSTHHQFSGEMATVAGWGQTSYQGQFSNVLLEVKLPTVTNSLCEEKMNFKLHPGQMCAGGEKGKDSCQVELATSSQSLIFLLQGDSGGPLTLNKTSQHVLIGAVSSGLRCGLKDKFGVFTRISYYRRWLEDNMKDPKFCQTGPDAKD